MTREQISRAASAMARLGAGKPKRFSRIELANRTARIQAVNERRKARALKLINEVLAAKVAGKWGAA